MTQKCTIDKIIPEFGALASSNTAEVTAMKAGRVTLDFGDMTVKVPFDDTNEKVKGLKVGDKVVYDDNWELKEVIHAAVPTPKKAQPQGSFYSRKNG